MNINTHITIKQFQEIKKEKKASDLTMKIVSLLTTKVVIMNKAILRRYYFVFCIFSIPFLI